MAVPEEIFAWQDDPGEPPGDRTPVSRPGPDLTADRLAIAIVEAQPEQAPREPGSADFRWWTAADALARARDFWTAVLPAEVRWNPEVGDRLRVRLDGDEPQLNAFYDRQGLEFFHDTAGGVTCWSGESPDVVAHELGHAVLDALRPELWDAAGIEPAAFHESFGDLSALLAALTVPELAAAVLDETAGKLWRSSQISRVAEQLGWAIRQGAPDRADSGALRDAANSWFYRDPATLPPDGPATVMSSQPHFFSRIFTGAFLKIVAAALDEESEADAEAVQRIAVDLGRILVAAVATAPIVPTYLSQVAAHMLEADRERSGRYQDALRFGFVRHGVLAPQGAQTVVGATPGEAEGGQRLREVPLSGTPYGLARSLLVETCAQPQRFAVAGAAPDAGPVVPPSGERAAELFVEDLLRLGRVDDAAAPEPTLFRTPLAYKTHELREAQAGFALRRRLFDCGLHPPGCHP